MFTFFYKFKFLRGGEGGLPVRDAYSLKNMMNKKKDFLAPSPIVKVLYSFGDLIKLVEFRSRKRDPSAVNTQLA